MRINEKNSHEVLWLRKENSIFAGADDNIGNMRCIALVISLYGINPKTI